MPTEAEQKVEGAKQSDDPVVEDAAIEADSPTEETAAEKDEAK